MTTPAARRPLLLLLPPLLLAAACPVVVSSPTTNSYYLSSASHADDANPGTSPEKPWRHLSKVAGLRLAEGESVLLERGSVFVDETLEVMLPASATLGAYGNTSRPRPQISSLHGAGRQDCVTVIGPQNVRIEELHVSGCGNGIVVLATMGTTVKNVSIHSNFIRDIRKDDSLYNPSGSPWGAAIWLRPSGGQSSMSAISVTNNVGLRISSFFKTSLQVDGLDFGANTVQGCYNNCVQMVQGSDLHLRDSVFLRDNPERWFMYGTTDVIIGSIVGNNSIERCDFNARGEYTGGPDGCAIDFETGATGFIISSNTISHSFGGGIMVFGHAHTSKDLTLTDNVFIKDGCMQPAGDRAGIAFMCPGGNKPSGVVSGNTFTTCPGVPAMFDNPAVPGCSENMQKINNTIDGDKVPIPEPQMDFRPPSPASTDPVVSVPFVAAPPIAGTIVRYTTDGSRPSESSPELPAQGMPFTFPGPAFVFNVRAFPNETQRGHLLPSVTNGAVVERYRYVPRGHDGGQIGSFLSSFDGLEPASQGGLIVKGWTVDTSLAGGGVPPTEVTIRIDSTTIATVIANVSRPDLVAAHISPNPEHGFEYPLSPQQVALLQKGEHVIDVFASGSPLTEPLRRLNGAPRCTCAGKLCSCD